jgi:hypothetical protein
MKSKKPLLALFLISSLGASILLLTSSPLRSRLPIEILPAPSAQVAENSDQTLPFGHTLGTWPASFRGEPIVTRLTYIKGPPDKFIDQMMQVWRPVEVELTLLGPKTISPRLNLDGWRSCFQSEFSCSNEKDLFWAKVFPDQKTLEKKRIRATWFESPNRTGPHGVRLLIEADTYRIDRFAVITPNGTTQVFSLKSVLNPIGQEARDLFLRTMGGLQVSDELDPYRISIENKLKNVNIEGVKKLSDPRSRLERLILVQNWIYSYLSVNPGSMESYFHLAGITHRLAMDLLNAKKRYFENQEAWIVSFQPLLGTLIRYAKDFPNSEPHVKNMEALLQDFLLKQSQIGTK